uniref:Uncharacterized protein n=1 Tax=Anopheles melas TaxID=34690 RepID=A0A182UC97_9DIPT
MCLTTPSCFKPRSYLHYHPHPNAPILRQTPQSIAHRFCYFGAIFGALSMCGGWMQVWMRCGFRTRQTHPGAVPGGLLPMAHRATQPNTEVRLLAPPDRVRSFNGDTAFDLYYRSI